MEKLTPKEKAQQIIAKFKQLNNYSSMALPLCDSTSKECALIAVDEILKSTPCTKENHGGSDNRGNWSYATFHPNLGYWEQVREEIEKL